MRFFTIQLIIILVISQLSITGQTIRYSVAQPYIQLSAYSNKQSDAFSFYGNQAGLAKVKQSGVGVFGERRFMLAENSLYAIAAAVPTGLGNFGLQVNYAGFSNFNENKIGLAYARSAGSKVDIGVQFNYYGYRIPGYQNAAAVNFEAGLIMHLTDRLSAGVHAYNPVSVEIGKSGQEKLASAYKLGMGYDVSDNFYIGAEFIKEEDKPVNVLAGVQYHFAEKFFARCGLLSETGSVYGGAGVAIKIVRLDLTTNYHPQLGFSPGLLFILNFKNQKE